MSFPSYLINSDNLFQNSQQLHGPFLVVVPLSTITNWAKEFRKWLPDMNVVVYVGNRASREVSEEAHFYIWKEITSKVVHYSLCFKNSKPKTQNLKPITCLVGRFRLSIMGTILPDVI